MARDPLNEPTNPDATPLLDGWGWGDYWSADEWIVWHRAMSTRYGQPYANRRFLEYWVKQGLGAAPLNARTFDTAFRDYAKSAGFFDGLYYGVGNIMRPAGTVINDVPRAIDSTISIGTTVLPLAVAAVAVWYFWPAIRTALAARPS